MAIYVAIYRYLKKLENVGVTTEVARSGGGTTTPRYHKVNYPWEAYAVESNCWAVFRFNTNANRTWPWYLLIQANRGDVNNFGIAPGNPGLVSGSAQAYSYTMVAYQAAIGVGGDQNPWNGTGATMGDNLKGTSVWKTPTGGTGVLVCPRSNNIDGAHVTNKENCTNFYSYTDYSTKRQTLLHFWSDDDSFMMGIMPTGRGDMWLAYNGVYTPLPGISVARPFVQFQQQAVNAGNYGTRAGTDGGGGIVTPNGEVHTAGLYWYDEEWYMPNRASATYLDDIIPLRVGCMGEYFQGGLLGSLSTDLISATNGVNYVISKDGSKISLGQEETGFVQFLLPWNAQLTRPRIIVDPSGFEIGFGG
jgi:hypothetical protein